MYMSTTVGTKEFRDRLSSYLDLVESGEELIITDHGRARVRVLPADAETTLERLVREGRVTKPSRMRKRLAPLVKATGPTMTPGEPVASDLIERR